jgi:penicillin-binding protein 1B
LAHSEQPTSKKKSILKFLFKLSLISIVVFSAYVFYLNTKVQNKFEGQRWQLPLQVFSEVLAFQKGDKINLEQVKRNLLVNQYKRVNTVAKPGEFALSSRRVIIYQRAFDFGEGLIPSHKLTINAKGGIVTGVFKGNKEVTQAQIEPVLLDRIVPENKEDRILLPLQRVPEQLLDTLLLVEDRDFYFHYGVSPVGIIRALYQNIKAGRTVQGGSTLTQQLVKNMFLTREKSIIRKVNEAIMALLLEFHYSKDQLLEAYVNEVYLGQHYANGIYGFGLAAQFYFDKDIEQLSVGQMATLVGVIKGPSYYDPWRYAERAKKRRDIVLKLMFDHEMLAKSDYLAAVKQPLQIKTSRKLANKKRKYPAYLSAVKRELAQILGDQSQAQGLKVFTHFSPFHQYSAEKAIAKRLPELEKNSAIELQVAMVITDTQSAQVKAIIGDKRSGYAGFNRAINARRPVGSLLKPFVYLLALERYQQYQLGTMLEDKPLSIEVEAEDVWQPKNYDGKYRKQASIYDSLSNSLNVPTVNLGLELGLEPLANTLHLAGYDEDIVLHPSLLLGSIGMSAFEVNQLYIPIVNKGLQQRLSLISKVVSGQGETYWQETADELPIFSNHSVYLLNYALRGATTTGTAKSLTWRLPNKIVAGKTGTTNDQRDSWFSGFDEDILITTWLGNDENKPTRLTGSSGALVLFSDVMKAIGTRNISLKEPVGVEQVPFDKQTGLPLAQACDDQVLYPAVNDGLAFQYKCSAQVVKAKKKKSWFEKLFGK